MIEHTDLEAAYLSAFRTLLATRNHPSFLRFLYLHNPQEATATGLSESLDYYVFAEDKAALGHLREDLAETLNRAEAIVDLGPGDAVALTHKVAPFLALPSVRRYWAVDANRRVFEPLAGALAGRAPGVGFEPRLAEFLDDPSSVPTVPNAIYLMLGNTIADLPVYSPGQPARGQLTRYLAALRDRIPKSSRFIVSIDTGSEPERILRAYRSDLTPAFLRRGLDWLGAQDPELAPVCSVLVPEVTYDEAASCVVFAYRASGTVGGRYPISEGGRLVAGVSYRFPAGVFADSLRIAGFAVEGSAGRADGTVRLFLAA